MGDRGRLGQARMNTAVSDLAPLPEELLVRLRPYDWMKAFWYGGK